MSKLFQVSLIVFLLSWAACLQAIAQGDENEVRRGDAAFKDQNYQLAINEYKDALKINPENLRANLMIAKAYMLSYPKNLAAKHLRKVVSLTPNPDNKLIFQLAMALQLNHEFDEAIENYRKSDPLGHNRKEVYKRVQECENGKRYVARPVRSEIGNLGKQLNTINSEYLPYITADLKALYFTSRRPGSTGGKQAPDGQFFEDIYVSYNKNGTWDTPKRLPSPVNTDIDDACIGISPDGQTMFVYKGTNGGDIYISELKGSNWSKPIPFEFNTKNFESSACLSEDGRKLFFVSDRAGNKDIYVCFRTVGGKWTAPRRLSGVVNTPYDEESPFLHPDGRTLYFSSKGPSTMGGYDIMKVQFATGDAVGTAENLGYPINTAGDDLYFVLSPDGRFGFYSSEKEGGYGRQDLYTIKMDARSHMPKLTILKGKVRDEVTGKPIEATITVTDNDANETVGQFKSNAETGDYVIALPSGKNYGITIEKDSRLFYSENVYLTNDAGFKEVRKDIVLASIKPGARTVLNNVFFDFGKWDLRKASYPELQRLIRLMNRESTMKVEISGHTDNVGDNDLNLKLSNNRAKVVVDYLIKHGVKTDRLVSKGYASSQPLADNKTDEGKQLNRRTEFKVLSR